MTQLQMKRKKKKRPLPGRDLMVKLAGLIAAKGTLAWMRTVDLRAVYYDRAADPVLGIGGPKIYIFWHEYLLLPLSVRGHCHLAMLLSQHGDADVLARVAQHVGFDCVRGSTFRGGVRALMELEQRSRRQHLTITPDGPRGPRRQLAQGPIYLASRLQLPLVLLGLGCDRPWRMPTWDRFAVPRPFSRVRAIVSPQLMLPADLDRSGIEHCRQRVERLLNCLTTEAEAWAASGTRKAGEVSISAQSAPPPRPWTKGAAPACSPICSRAA